MAINSAAEEERKNAGRQHHHQPIPRAHDPLIQKKKPATTSKAAAGSVPASRSTSGKNTKNSQWQFFSWLNTLKDVYGASILMTIVLVSHLCVRFIPVSVTIGYYLREFGGVKAAEVQAYKAVARAPYAMSPLFGYLSDALHFRGYNKAPYIAFSSVVAMGAYAVVGFSPVGLLSLPMVILGFVTMNLQMEYCGLLVRAKYAEKLKENPDYSTDLISFVQGGDNGCPDNPKLWHTLRYRRARYAPTCTDDDDTQSCPARYVFAVCVLPAMLPLYPAMTNLLQEKPEENAPCCGLSKGTSKYGKKYLTLCIFMGFEAIFLMVGEVVEVGRGGGVVCLGMMENSLTRCVLGLVASVFLAIGFIIFTPRMIAKVAIFFLLICICSLSNSGAEYYFYTDTAEQYPEGPHFSAMFYLTVRSFVRSSCLFIGMYAYNRWLRDCKYKIAWHSRYGLHPHIGRSFCYVWRAHIIAKPDPNVAFVSQDVGQNILADAGVIANAMMHMEQGLESTVFAFMAGAFMMGGQVGTFLGAYLLKQLGVEPQGAAMESRQFDNLWVAELLSAVACIPPLIMMLNILPDKTPSERIDVEDDDDDNSEEDTKQQHNNAMDDEEAGGEVGNGDGGGHYQQLPGDAAYDGGGGDDGNGVLLSEVAASDGSGVVRKRRQQRY
eukprot:jgi/Bigna1/72138/fgenesh1_pg.18_\